MIKARFASAALLLIAVITPYASVKQAAQTSKRSPVHLQLEPCQIPQFSGRANCGTYQVYENRVSRKGRKISLKIVVLPATGSKREPDPFVYIPGGPGSSATEEAPFIAEEFGKILEHRDLLFVDQRGTGGSHPLNCQLYKPADPQSYLGYFFPLEDVRKCREQLEQQADLKLYTTSIAMDDLDEVRAALGYERLNLLGTSYGTRAALVYLKQHPHHVRTLTLQGVAPPGEFMPLAFPQHNERALQGVIGECLADKDCGQAFPNLKSEATAVLNRLVKGPVEVSIKPDKLETSAKTSPPVKAETLRISLSRDLVAEAIRYMLYNPAAASRVPLYLHSAAQGDFAPLADAALMYRKEIVAGGSNGLYLSITCAEDLPWIRPGEGKRVAAHTFLGDYRLSQQREACALWPRGTIPTDFNEIARSSVPVLLLTGEWDPVTPPTNAELVRSKLSNSLHVVVPHGAHGFSGLQGIDCILRLLVDFVQTGSLKGLNTSCASAIRRQGFPIQLIKE